MERQTMANSKVWQVSDELWRKIEPIILEADPPKQTGRKRANQRKMLNGILYRFTTGCQWNRLPKELGDDSTLHRTYRRWVERGIFNKVWEILLQDEEGMAGLNLKRPLTNVMRHSPRVPSRGWIRRDR